MAEKITECAKCGLLSKDPTLTFLRFPMPSAHDPLQAKVWAKFCFPDVDWSSKQSLIELYEQHKMICSKHFDKTSFTNIDKKKLRKFAIPTEARNIMAELRNEQPHSSIESPQTKVVSATAIAHAVSAMSQNSPTEECPNDTSEESINCQDMIEEIGVTTIAEIMPREQKIYNKSDMIKKCAVIECSSNSSENDSLTFVLFPSTRHIALKWLMNLENLIPNVLFKPVQKLYICENHFENRFLVAPGKLASNAYPTLFTPEEIATGVPENFENDEYQTYVDHDYCMFRKDIPVPITDNSKGQPIFRILPSGSPKESETNDYSCNIETEIDFDNDTTVDYQHDTSIKRQQIRNRDASKFTRPPRTALISTHSTKMPDSIKVLEAKYKQSLKQVKRLEKIIINRNKRIKQMKFDKKTCFDKLTKDVENPLAKKFLWMQVRSAPKNARGRRFTDEEKTICIFIQQQNPQCYRIMSKIFTLPSYKVLRKFIRTEMALKNKVDSSPS